MKYLLKFTYILFASLLTISCGENEFRNSTEEITSYSNNWYRQAEVDLGARIIMFSEQSGAAVAKGRGNISGGVYLYESGAWHGVYSFPYSDFPQIEKFQDKLWVVNHLTHSGFYKPVLTEISDSVKQIPLPDIMWDETDYVMWKTLKVQPGESTAWMAGQQGHILYFNGSRWVQYPSPINKDSLDDLLSGDINDISITSGSSGWAAGKDGLILRYKEGVWTNYPSPTSRHLNRIAMISDSKGWIAGANGTLLELSNGSWQPRRIESSATFNSIFAADSSNVWLCGTNSTLFYYNGIQWIKDKNAEYLEDNFEDVSIVKKDNAYLIWLIGGKGIYTNNQALGFSFSEHTAQSLIRPSGRNGMFLQDGSSGGPDLVVFNDEAPPVYYRNNGTGIFSEVSDESGLLNSVRSPGGAVSADFNNDGYTDIIHAADNERYRFYLGAGEGKLIDFTERSGLILDSIESNSLISLAAADFNNDGNLDLYISNNERTDMLFANDGAGHFRNVIESSNLPVTGKKTYGACLSDFNGDGLIDILYPLQSPRNGALLLLYLNTGEFSFSSKPVGPAETDKDRSIQTTVALAEDFNNDGMVDILLHHQKEAPWLLINKGGAEFENVSSSVGFNERIFHPEPVNGIAAAADVNNDGWIDLFISSKLYLNIEGKRFNEVSEFTGINFTGNPAFGDIEGDGDYDLFIGRSEHSIGMPGAVLYRNNLTSSRSIKLTIEGVYSNCQASGAKIQIIGITGQDTLFKHTKITAAGSAPMLPNSLSNHNIGLPNGARGYNLEVTFPSGEREIVENIKPGGSYIIKETSSLDAFVVSSFKALYRTWLLADKTKEAVKLVLFLLVAALLVYAGRKAGAARFVNRWYFAGSLLMIYLITLHFTILSGGAASTIVPFIYIIVAGSVSGAAARYMLAKIDSEIISHYRLEKLIGKGGMGRVYLASDLNTRQKTALKVLMPEMLENEENRKRFSEEGRTLASFNHPYIVKVHEIGETETGGYIAMEYLGGGTLKEYLNNKYPLGPEEIKTLALQICEGLEEIHSKGIIHRDLKTGNIMLDDECNIRIMDFGLSKSSLVSTMTSLGTVLGTLGYCAPEQVTNIMVDNRSDIFSLGVILYELSTHKLPFSGENEIALIHSIFNVEPPLPSTLNSTIPAILDHIIMKCISKNPNDRFNSVSEIKAQLNKL